MTAGELRWTAVALVAFGVFIGWGLFGETGLIFSDLKDSSLAEWLTVLVAGLSAGAVLYLGLQANRISRSPLEVLEIQRQREARFLFAYIQADLMKVNAWCRTTSNSLDEKKIEALAVGTTKQRAQYFAIGPLGARIEMPEARAVISRLHLLDAESSNALARVMRSVDSIRLAIDLTDRAPTLKQRRQTLGAVQKHCRMVTKDVRVVLDAAHAVLRTTPPLD